MYSDPIDDWYHWRMAHAGRDETRAGLLVVAVTLLVVLVVPWAL